MEKTNRRNFLKTAAAGGLAAMSAPLFAAPSRSMRGMDEVRRARGNVASTVPMIDSCCPLPADARGVEEFVGATASYGVQGNLFVPKPEIKMHWNAKEASDINIKAAALAAKFPDAKFAGAIPLTDLDSALAEIEKCARKYKFAAVAFMPRNPDPMNASFDKVVRFALEKAAELNITVVLGTCMEPGISEYGIYSTGRFMDEASRLTSIASSLRIVIPFYGGAYTWLKAKAGESAPKESPFYFWAGEKISADAFKCVKNVFGSECLVFGSCGNMNYGEVLKNVENLSLGSDDFKKTCFKNANKLFGFDVKEWE